MTKFQPPQINPPKSFSGYAPGGTYQLCHPSTTDGWQSLWDTESCQ